MLGIESAGVAEFPAMSFPGRGIAGSSVSISFVPTIVGGCGLFEPPAVTRALSVVSDGNLIASLASNQ